VDAAYFPEGLNNSCNLLGSTKSPAVSVPDPELHQPCLF